MKILVTGAAGFIGSALIRKLAESDNQIIAIDNINDYYDVELKYARLEALGLERPFLEKNTSQIWTNLSFIKMDICDRDKMDQLFSLERFDKVVHLAAQAGVRHSIQHPEVYMDANLDGFFNVLENCRRYQVKHLVFASSSSVYGLNAKVPFSEDDKTDAPKSLYAATKKANELMAYSYSQLYGFATTGLRFFTVYGPWGRPDMAPFKFTRKILKGETIDVYNQGDMIRDFTYIEDIVDGSIRAINSLPERQKLKNGQEGPAFKIYNIGCGHPVKLMDFIHELENALGRTALIHYMPMQPGDVHTTFADITRIQHDFGYQPQIELKEGIQKFVRWFQSEQNPIQ